MISCAVIGATGYAGAELSRLLACHPEVEELILSSASAGGEAMSSIYPNLAGPSTGCRARASSWTRPRPSPRADVVFAALPSGHAEDIARCLRRPRAAFFVDMSADFRFGSRRGDLLEVVRQELRPARAPRRLGLRPARAQPRGDRRRSAPRAGPRIIGNPGCYPTASTLGLFPALRLGLAEREGIVIDAKSGVTGAGKEPTKTTHYSEAADSITPYKIGEHRHGPEIARRPRARWRASRSARSSRPTSRRWAGASSRPSTSGWRSP